MRLYLFTFTQHPGFFEDRSFKMLINVKPMHESVPFLIASSEHLFGLQKDVWCEKITLLLIGCVTFQDCFQLVQGVNFQFKAFQLTVMFVFFNYHHFQNQNQNTSFIPKVMCRVCFRVWLPFDRVCCFFSFLVHRLLVQSVFKNCDATPKKATRGTLTNEYVRQ